MSEEEIVVAEPSLDNIMAMNIAMRLHAVMTEAGRIAKTVSKTGLKYNFVAHDSVMTAIQPLLIKYRIIALPTVTELAREGNVTSVRLRVNFINIDFPQEILSVDSFGDGIDQQDKGPGKAYSYAYKYAFLKTFCLATGDDPENDNIMRGPRVNSVHRVEVEPTPLGVEVPSVEKPKPVSGFLWKQKEGCITESQSRLLFVRRKSAGLVSPEEWKQFLKDQGWVTENNIPKSKEVFDAVLAFIEQGGEGAPF